MGAFLGSDQLPAVLHFESLDADELKRLVRGWAKSGQTMILNDSGAAAPTAGPQDFVGGVINFGALPWTWVQASRPDTDRPILVVHAADIEWLRHTHDDDDHDH